MKRNKLFWGLLIFCAINFAAHLCFYGSLPDVVPTHWGADGQANGWGPKSTVLIMAALPALMLILMAVLPRIDPKHQNYEKFKGVWNASLTALTIFMSAMSWFSELSVFGLIPEGSSLVPPRHGGLCFPQRHPVFRCHGGKGHGAHWRQPAPLCGQSPGRRGSLCRISDRGRRGKGFPVEQN